jgi:hypothetical protein
MKKRSTIRSMEKRTRLLALLSALGSVAAQAQTNVYSLQAVSHLQNNTNSIVATSNCCDDPAPSMPNLQEVCQILGTNLQGLGASELDRAAVQGLVHQLEPRVSLVTADARSANMSALAEARVFEDSFAYVRVGAVTSNLPGAFRAAYVQMTETNKTKIKGLVLDLRFAGGLDYAAAAKVADSFLSSDHPLLDWQSGSAHATLKADAITVPVAILVNSQTAAGAEALAAVLRDAEIGLILGGQTAGQASIFKEFPLRDGSKLRVAVAPVQFGAGKTLPHGVEPDIAINTSLEDERAYLRDPFKVLHPPPATKMTAAVKEFMDEPRMNETELIREHNNGDAPDQTPASNTPDVAEPAPALADPALSRALDLLIGLAVVQPNRPG